MNMTADAFPPGHVKTVRVDGKDRLMFTPRGTIEFLRRQDTPEARRWLGLIEATIEELRQGQPGIKEETLLAEAVRLGTLGLV